MTYLTLGRRQTKQVHILSQPHSYYIYDIHELWELHFEMESMSAELN